ncbi:hypothetical protein GCM10027290_58730 [Micromonospora sonneratiae]|uniref:Fe2OG dioxygenase domain-containing protein n=1 Tax=Micromonospora sonneratiae TaxID=1184706 RepID=A0ABW3YLX8_9ACTN
MFDTSVLLKDLKRHVDNDISPVAVEAARRQYSYLGHAKVSFLAPPSVKEAVAAEVQAVIDAAGVRRDLEIAQTDNSPRRMRNVGQADIFEFSKIIPQVYAAEPLLQAISAVAGESVHPCPWEPEQYIITCLEKDGDTHGWHWDDYTFALVWVVEAPPVSDGGFVQCVPGTSWNKDHPDVNRQLVNRPIYSLELFPGDIYLMKTNTTMHRVYPVKSGRRKIINMSYASTSDLSLTVDHRTMSYFRGVVPEEV